MTDDVREAAKRIVEFSNRPEKFRHLLEELNCWGPVIARALLSRPVDAQNIAAIVETYTDILSPETARKVASRIRAIPEQPASPKGWLGRGINDPDSGA